MEKIAVLGAGAMGTAIASHLNNLGHQVNLWGTDLDEEIVKTRKQKKLAINIPESIDIFHFNQIKQALRDRKIVIFCISSEGVERVSKFLASYIKGEMIVINIGKGIPEPPYLTFCDLIENNLIEGSDLSGKVNMVVMGGPARAIEIVRGEITEVIFASSDLKIAEFCCQVFQGPTLRASFTSDKVGVELCAAIKNCYALAVGIADGLSAPNNNFKAALMAHATEEMAKIVVAKGGKIKTVLGLAGVGDLYVTSQAGRNRTLGCLLGKAISLKEALERLKGETVEGYPTLRGMHRIANELEKKGGLIINKDLSLFCTLYGIFYVGESLQNITKSLL